MKQASLNKLKTIRHEILEKIRQSQSSKKKTAWITKKQAKLPITTSIIANYNLLKKGYMIILSYRRHDY